VLIVFMLTVLLLMQRLMGNVKIGRRTQAELVTGH
jgi:hypothetical protein